MLPDLTPVTSGEITLIEWSRQQALTVEDLRRFTDGVLDEIAAIIGDADDAGVTFIPDDPNADDPHAPEPERYQGWSLAHLVCHTTATSEEWAAVSSLLARGIAYGRDPRPRYETDWHTMKTRAQVDQRLAESRRMRMGYLDTFPDAPQLHILREMSERFIANNGNVNAFTAYLYGLKHEISHLDQMRETARQMRVAAETDVANQP